MKEELTKVIESLADGFQTEADAENEAWLRTILTDYSHLELEKPEHFSLLLQLTHANQTDLLVRTVLMGKEPAEPKKKHLLHAVYEKYDFIVRHLKSIIATYEGSGCSTDKTRWLLDSYANYLVTGKRPVVEEKSYWHPESGTAEQWFDFIEATIALNYGEHEAYMATKSQLITLCKNLIKEEKGNKYIRYSTHPLIQRVGTESEKDLYIFEHPETKDIGTILVNDKAETSYRFYLKQEERYLTFKDRKLIPEWFQSLLK